MSNKNPAKPSLLWPFSKKLAVLMIPLAWIGAAVLFYFSQTYLGWPDAEFRNTAMLVIMIASAVPVGLIVLDFFASRGASVDILGVKLNFGSINLAAPDAQSGGLDLPDNIGIPGTIVSDSSPMQIEKTLEKATASEVVVVDLKEGRAWWVTRLLALAAGSVQAANPRVIVFTGTRENRAGVFLGWSSPDNVLEALLRDKWEYKKIYEESRQIARQLGFYMNNNFLQRYMDNKSIYQNVLLADEVARYTCQDDYSALGEDALGQIILDRLGRQVMSAAGVYIHLENPPDHLTNGRLSDLFEHCMYKNHIDTSWPPERQVEELVSTLVPYIALTESGKYMSVITRDEGFRLLLKQLVDQQKEKKEA